MAKKPKQQGPGAFRTVAERDAYEESERQKMRARQAQADNEADRKRIAERDRSDQEQIRAKQRRAEAEQKQIDAKIAAKRKAYLASPLSDDERDELKKLEALAMSGRSIGGTQMRLLADYRIRATNKPKPEGSNT